MVMRNGYGLAGPIIPVVDVHIGAADGSAQDADAHIIGPDRRQGNLLQPEARFRLGLDQRLHRETRLISKSVVLQECNADSESLNAVFLPQK